MKARMLNKPKPERLIKDMETGETGYIVPWAVDWDTGEIHLNHTVSKKKGGTASVWIEATENDYVVDAERPRYRNFVTGKWDDEKK